MNPKQEIALHHYVQSKLGEPFQYGVNDCPLFVAGAIDVMYKTSLKEEFADKWNSKASAWKYVKQNGTISEHLKDKECSVVDFNHIQTGDIIVMEQLLSNEKQWRSVAVCLGSNAAIVRDDIGVDVVSIKSIPNVVEVLRWQS